MAATHPFNDSADGYRQALRWLGTSGNIDLLSNPAFEDRVVLVEAANQIWEYFEQKKKGLVIPNLRVEHPYLCEAADEIQYYRTVDEFISEWDDVDIDLNLCFRWDIHKNEVYSKDPEDRRADSEGVFHFLLQRKGYRITCKVEQVNATDFSKLNEFLRPHWEKIKRIWEPLSSLYPNPEKNLAQINQLAQTKEELSSSSPNYHREQQQRFIESIQETVHLAMTQTLGEVVKDEMLANATRKVARDLLLLLDGTGNNDGYHVVPHQPGMALLPVTQEEWDAVNEESPITRGLDVSGSLAKLFDEINT